MALIWIDGFDHYATADMTKKWTNGFGSISAAAGRRGGGAANLPYNGGNLNKSISPGATFITGFALNTSSIPSLNYMILARFRDGTTTQSDLRLWADGTLSVTRNGTALTNGTSTFVLSPNTWYYIEWKITIADSIAANSCKVRINGVDIITVATGQDTKNTANASASQFLLGPNDLGSGPTTVLFDDFYLCDGSGTTNNDFLGDVRIDTLYPNADGTYSQFTPSTGSTHYTLVDETAPNTSDYNSGTNSGDRDSYQFTNLTALTSQIVYGVQVNAAMLKDDAGLRSAAAFARSGSTNSDGTTAALGTSQVYVSQIYSTDPNGGAAWTEGTVNAAEFGIVVTA